MLCQFFLQDKVVVEKQSLPVPELHGSVPLIQESLVWISFSSHKSEDWGSKNKDIDISPFIHILDIGIQLVTTVGLGLQK